MHDSALRAPRRAGVLTVLACVATLVVTTYLLLPSGSRAQVLASEAMIAVSCLVAGLHIARAVQAGAWRRGIWLAWTLFLVGIASALFFLLDVTDPGSYGPRSSDVAFLAILIPMVGLARAEYRQHVGRQDRRELSVDVVLVTASLATIAYVLIIPEGAGAQTSVSTAVVALIAATEVTAFGALVLLIPSRAHVLQAAIFAAFAAATLGFGWQWTHGTFGSSSAWIDLTFALCPLGFAGMVALEPLHHGASSSPSEPRRWTRPLQTSLSVVAACAALIVVATLDREMGLGRAESSALIAVLGLGVAARIVANQVASTQAHREVRAALADKEGALAEADLALDRVREANETLRRSEEHLRLVFDAAVDGVVELDERDIVIRANESFCRMVGLDRAVMEGQPWSALAASVAGVDQAFASLPRAGEAEIKRPEGQPLYLESRVSKIPGTPPRTLMLVRDVTAGRVADQTIRSLFQFLQDRDEDRTRLLRRTNAAIESERNRIARDLHDGPVQGVSAAALSLEAALLMIKAGDIERGVGVLARIREELTMEADALRRLMSGLRPPVLEERGLVPALREMVSRFGEEQSVHTELAGRIAGPLPEDLETLAYRVVQEALSNAAKHASAPMLTVTVGSDATQLRIEVQDDGRGFDSARAREFLREGRVGLASMRERVELASGTFVVRSSPGRGTTIVATLPIDLASADRELAVHEAS